MEQLLLLALFLLVTFVGSLARWLKARMKGSFPAETRPPDVTVRWPRLPPEEPARLVAAPPVAYPRPSPPRSIERRPPPRLRPLGRSDLRRAVVLMTVLGPCRALEGEDPARQR